MSLEINEKGDLEEKSLDPSINPNEDLNIKRNLIRMISRRLTNPKFKTNLEVAKSLGYKNTNGLYKICEQYEIDSNELANIRRISRGENVKSRPPGGNRVKERTPLFGLDYDAVYAKT